MSPRAGLDRAAVVAAAAALADEESLEGVTLTRLAEHFGVRTPSLYNHVAGLAGLRRELTLMGLRELGDRLGRAAMGKTTDAAMFAMAEAYRGFVKERPGLYATTVRSYLISAPQDREIEAAAEEGLEPLLVVLASYGLSGDEALHAARGFRSVVHGFATLEIAEGFGMPVDTDESFRWLVRALLGGFETYARSS